MCVRNSSESETDKYSMSKGREGKQEEAGHKEVGPKDDEDRKRRRLSDPQ